MQLLSPITIGSVELRNRVVSTAHAAFLDFWNPEADGQRYMADQERRARGGTGLIILTAQHVHHSSLYAGHFNADMDDLRRKPRELSSRLHNHGTRAISQLFHVGVTINTGFPLMNPYAPFGGIKRSGHGREQGHFGLDEFTYAKTIDFHVA